MQVESWPLIPSVHQGKIEEHASNIFRDMKEKVENHSRIEFKLKDFRSTCAKMMKDRISGPEELATKQLRHSGRDVTYRCYAQIRSDRAVEDLNNPFLPKEVAIKPIQGSLWNQSRQ